MQPRGGLLFPVVRMRLAAADLVDQVRILWWYGKLIGNTDMHLGNVSFRFRPDPRGRVQLNLAPAYDMLPMLYAPLSGGEIPEEDEIIKEIENING